MILVTGGTGLVGSHLLYELLQEETAVRATFRNRDKLKKVLHAFSYYTDQPQQLFDKIEWVEANINDLPKLTSAFEGVTHVYHCAALVSFDPNDYYKLRKINIEGTANVVNLCISKQVKKLCYVSSVAALGASVGGDYISEETPWNSDADHHVYAITKYGAEMEVWRGTEEGCPAVIVNPGIIVGPGFWRSSSGSLFSRVYRGMKYYTTGISGYVDIDDVVKPMVQLMKSDIINQRYILAGENLSFKSFIDMLAPALGVEPPQKKASALLLNIGWRLDWLRAKFKKKRRRLTRRTVKSIQQDSKFDSSKIEKALNYTFKPIKPSVEENAKRFLKDLDLRRQSAT